MNFTRRELWRFWLLPQLCNWSPAGRWRRASWQESGDVALDKLPDWSACQAPALEVQQSFVPSQWSEPKLGGYDWKAANVKIVDGALQLTVSEKASAEVISGGNSAFSSAKWEVDVTLPDDEARAYRSSALDVQRQEPMRKIDFEIVGTKGLQLTVWANVDNQHKSVWVKWILLGDLSGKRYRLGIEYEAGKRVVFFIDGKEAAVVTPADTAGGAFPNKPMKPYFDLWVAAGAVMDTRWAGKWEPMAPSDKLVMTIHGYRRTDVGQ